MDPIFDLLELRHHFAVNMQAPRRIHNNDLVPAASCLFDGLNTDRNGIIQSFGVENPGIDFLTENT